MFRGLSQQLNFAATVSVLTLALFAVTSGMGAGGSDADATVVLSTIASR